VPSTVSAIPGANDTRCSSKHWEILREIEEERTHCKQVQKIEPTILVEITVGNA
jgi:hypothetical protein